MRPGALGRKNWLHVGSAKSGPKVAAILSVVESCRRLGIPVKDYLRTGLPGMNQRKLSEVAALTPARWNAARPCPRLVGRIQSNLLPPFPTWIDSEVLSQLRRRKYSLALPPFGDFVRKHSSLPRSLCRYEVLADNPEGSPPYDQKISVRSERIAWRHRTSKRRTNFELVGEQPRGRSGSNSGISCREP
jgi:hypothetical protein